MDSSSKNTLQPTCIPGINWIGLNTLIKREVGRFLSVYLQTIVAPVVTMLLFYTVFALAFGGLERDMGGIPFLEFLAPGLIMMTMAQNSFANTSSSLVISKVQGNIVDILMPPLSNLELTAGYLIGGILRGLAVGVAGVCAVWIFMPLPISTLWMIIVFSLLGTMMLSALGTLAGLWSDKFDHMAAFTNFVITPMTFLSGTFYSVNVLPDVWHGIALYNPFFYMIDGFRAGFIGHADGDVLIGLMTLLGVNAGLCVIIYLFLKTGYKIKT